MSDSTTFGWITASIEQATKSANYCATGFLPAIDPGLEVEGLGTITLPLKRNTAKQLVARCQVAPYGKGKQTLVNKKVRNTFQLEPTKFQLGEPWNSAITRVTQTVAEQLGLPADQLEAKPYKLLVYERGGFFLAHRDSEKQNRMVASLIVVLPNPFEGGTLIVRHGESEEKLAFHPAAAGEAACYAAFYADCEHEVHRVTKGVRICLAYNLVLKPRRGKRSAGGEPAAPAEAMSRSIGAWVARQPATPLVFALEHHYTQRGLSLDLLKGGDRQLADQVVAAAQKAGCLVHLAQVSRHLMQFADAGSYGRGYSRYDRGSRRAIEIGEVYQDELIGTQWTDPRGRKQPWGSIVFDLSSIVSSVPIDQWKPTSEEYEGYTGNAGNTLDRWYHRSAVVVWHRDHHFDIVADSGAPASMPLFASMVDKLGTTPERRFEAAHADCLRFARAIISRWPHRGLRYRDYDSPENSALDKFPEHLLTLYDPDTIATFLAMLAQRDPTARIDSLIVAASREFGWRQFARELKQLILSWPNRRDWEEIPARDIEWLAAYCLDNSPDEDKLSLARELCRLAVERFSNLPSPGRYYDSTDDRSKVSFSPKSLQLLLKSVAVRGEEEDLSSLIRAVEHSPKKFSLDDWQVPSLKSLIPWSRKQFGEVHPLLLAWLNSVRKQLEAATASEPVPPTNWARPAEVDCNCQYCKQLNDFLADPTNEVGHIAAREDLRRHIIDSIHRHQCDVKHSLMRKGSPHSLRLTKTTGSFQRAVKRFESDRRLLSELPA